MPYRANLALDEQTTLAILRPYFVAARERFVIYSKTIELPVSSLKKVRLECDVNMRDSERHFAGASTDGDVIAVAPEMADLPEDTVAAMFAHEWGHILDHLHPGTFVLDDEEDLLILPDIDFDDSDKRSGQARLARMRQWRDREDHAIELVADKIAEAVVGARIGYSGPCLLQGFNRGVSRPESLR